MRQHCETTWLSDIVTFHDWDDPVAVLAEAAIARGFAGATIGTDHYSYSMPVARFTRLVAALPQARFVDIGRSGLGDYGWSSHRPRSHSCDALPI